MAGLVGEMPTMSGGLKSRLPMMNIQKLKGLRKLYPKIEPEKFESILQRRFFSEKIMKNCQFVPIKEI